MTNGLTGILAKEIKKNVRSFRAAAAAGMLGLTLLTLNGCAPTPPVEKPKPVAILTVEKSQVQSGQENKIELDGTIGGKALFLLQ